MLQSINQSGHTTLRLLKNTAPAIPTPSAKGKSVLIDWLKHVLADLHRKQVQFHDSTDSLVQGQLKGISSKKHYTCFNWDPFFNSYNIEKHTVHSSQHTGRRLCERNKKRQSEHLYFWSKFMNNTFHEGMLESTNLWLQLASIIGVCALHGSLSVTIVWLSGSTSQPW